MSDSEDYWSEPEQPRQKRHRFKTFAERVADVDVDVYRRLGPVRDVPQGGASSFTMEALLQWRELNSAEGFLEVAAAIHPLIETLPQLVHHSQEVFALLLTKVHMQHVLSLPAILALHAALARDLQEEHVTHMFAQLMPALAALLNEQGGDKDTEVLEQVFTCVSMLCKHLARNLAPRMPWVLSKTQGLRYARSPHARLFAAQSFGFLMRMLASLNTTQPAAAAPTDNTMDTTDGQPAEAAEHQHKDEGKSSLKKAIRALLAEHALQPDEQRTDGAGLLLAESVIGVSHGLHSRAPVVLELVFAEDLLTSSDFAKSGSTSTGIPKERLRARAAAVASVALERVLSHVRRGKCDVMWEVLLKEANKRLTYLQAAASGSVTGTAASAGAGAATTSSKSKSKRAKTGAAAQQQDTQQATEAQQDAPRQLTAELLSAYLSAARGIAHVAQSVHFFRASRVENYDPVLQLVARLMQPWAWPPAGWRQQVAGPQGDAGTAGNGTVVTEQKKSSGQGSKKRARQESGAAVGATSDGGCTAAGGTGARQEAEPFLWPSLPFQTLRLVIGIVYGHVKVVGASAGLTSLTRHVATWAPCFSKPSPGELLPFLASLLSFPAGPEVARMFAPRILGALGGLVLAVQDSSVSEAAALQRDVHKALGLLVQVCHVIQPRGVGEPYATNTLPLLMTAQPAGVKLAAAVRKLLSDWAAAVQQACQSPEAHQLEPLITTEQLATAWAILQLLPHSCESVTQALNLCVQAKAAAQAAVSALGTALQPDRLTQLLCLHGTATEMLACLVATNVKTAAETATPEQLQAHLSQLVSHAEDSLQWLQAHPGSIGAAMGAAAMMQGVRQHAAEVPAAIKLLCTQRLQDILPHLLPHLASPSQPVRAAVLQLLASFDQPNLNPLATGGAPAQPNGSKVGKVEVLPLLHAINSEACTLEAGRRWSVALIRQGGHVEYDRLPDYMVPALVWGLLGVMRVRFSPLWPGAVQALAACLQHKSKVSWPIVKDALTDTQHEFLTRTTNTTSHGSGRGRKGRGRPGTRDDARDDARDAPGSEDEEGEQEEGRVLHGDVEEEQEEQDLEGLAEGERRLATAASLESKFLSACCGAADEQRDSTDAVNRLAHLVKSLAKAPSDVMEPLSKDWVPLFLEYANASKVSTEPGSVEGVSVMSRVGARVYRTQLAEWLTFLSGIKGARGIHRSSEVQVAVVVQLDADEPSVQSAALKCLQAFKHKYLNQHMERLLRLADNKTLRSELAAFPLAPDAEGGISPAHRPGLLPVLTRVLFPKLRRRTGRLAGKGALGSARAAVLNFFAFAHPLELRSLLEAFIMPMEQVFTPPASAPTANRSQGPNLAPLSELEAVDKARLLPAPWWLKHVGSAPTSWWLQAVDTTQLAELPARRKVGFLNAFEDLLEHLGHRLAPLLPVLIALTMHLLQESTKHLQSHHTQGMDVDGAVIDNGKSESGSPVEEDRSREIRQSSLKLLSNMWLRFPAAADYNDAWDIFFSSVEPLMARLGVEAVAEKEPPLLRCALALAASPNLLPVLGNRPSYLPPTTPTTTTTPARLQWGSQPVPSWVERQLGGQLLRSCIGMLNTRNCSQASRSAVLDMIDCILEEAPPPTDPSAPLPASTTTTTTTTATTATPAGSELFNVVLKPWIDELLVALKSIITTAWQGKDSMASSIGQKAPLAVQKQYKNMKRRPNHAHRELAVLERLGWAVSSPATARLLGDALAALVTGVTAGAGARRGARARLDEVGLARALAALSALWGRLAVSDWLVLNAGLSAEGAPQADGVTLDQIQQYWEAMSPLALRLQSRESRAGLAAAYSAAAKLLPGDAPDRAASLLLDLTAWTTTTLDEPDYDKRMRAFSALQPAVWIAIGRWQVLPVLMACLHDVRDGTDLALRQAASASLERFITAAATSPPPHDSASDEGGNSEDTLPAHLLVCHPHHPHHTKSKTPKKQAATTPATATVTSPDGSVSETGPDTLAFLIPRVLYPQLRSQLSSPVVAVRQEHLQLLRALVLAFPTQFADLLPLTNLQDPETDFFLNASHLQLHRQVRALNKLAKLCRDLADASKPDALEQEQAGISVRCIMDIAVPLIQVSISGSQDAGSAHDPSQADADRGANVVDAAQKALAAAALALPWQQYDQLMSQCMRNMRARISKATIRAVCQVLDAFHFPLPKDFTPEQLTKYKVQAHVARKRPAAVVAAEPAVADAAAAPADGDNSDLSDAEEEEVAETVAEVVDEVVADGDMEEVADVAETAEDEEVAAVRKAMMVQQVLVRRVLPVLHRMLVSKAEHAGAPVARAPVALAIAKLVKLLPEDVERRELPRALGTLAGLLLERQQALRDDTRVVLVAMAKELGPRYMPYMCNVLRATLPDRGFTAHVLGYTLHAVMEGVVGHLLLKKGRQHALPTLDPQDQLPDQPTATVINVTAETTGDELTGLDEVQQDGSEDEEDEGQGQGQGEQGGGQMVAAGLLDDTLELALPVIDNEIFGQVAAAKEISQFAKNYKEVKKVRGYETFMLLAASCTFSSHFSQLMDLIRSKLHMAGVPSVRNRLSHLLQYAVRGVHANPTATGAPLAAWIQSTLQQGVALEEAARARIREAVGAAYGEAGLRQDAKVAAIGSMIQGTVAGVGKAKKVTLSDEEAAGLHYHLVADAALQLLRSAVRKGVLSGRSPQVLQLLDPLLPLLVRSLRGRHAPSVSVALRVLSHMVTLPLPHLPNTAPAAGKAVNSVLKRAPSAAHPLAQEGFRLLAALMRDCSTYQPTTQQVRFLLSWLFADRHADDSLERGPGFALLRAILARRLVVPEVYDVMNWVQKLMVKSQAAHVRSVAASCLLQFLLDFPLGPKRLAAHMAFLAANLNYEYEDGRLQVLGMIHQVVGKFPPEVVSAQAELFLLPLVTRLVNDPSARGRAAAAGALKALLAALPQTQLDAFATFCKQWVTGDNAQLRRAALQSLGLLADAEGGARFAKRLSDPELCGPLVACLRRQSFMSGLAVDESLETEEELGGSCPGWQEGYYCLIMMEKVLTSAPTALPYPAAAAAHNKSSTAASVTLWEALLPLLLHKHAWVRKAAARVLGIGLSTSSVSAGLLGKQGQSGQLAYALFMQLNCEGADEVTCRQAVKCLIPVAVSLHEQHQEEIEDNGVDMATTGATEQQPPANGAAVSHDTAANGQQANGHAATAGYEEEAGEDGQGGSGSEDDEEQADEGEEEEEDEGEADGDVQGDGDDGAPAVVDSDDGQDDAGDVWKQEDAARCVTLPGLMRRMARLADNNRYPFAQQRLAALRWVAAIATQLGASVIRGYLDLLMVPLYRLSEASQTASSRHTAVPPHVQEAAALAEEVLSHLRSLLGAELLLERFTAARERVKTARAARKQKAAVKVLLDPEAAAAARIKRGKRKAVGRKQKLEHRKRQRSASTYGGQKHSQGKRGGAGGRGGRGDAGRGRPRSEGRLYSKGGKQRY